VAVALSQQIEIARQLARNLAKALTSMAENLRRF
jgi:hypothetical protein